MHTIMAATSGLSRFWWELRNADRRRQTRATGRM